MSKLLHLLILSVAFVAFVESCTYDCCNVRSTALCFAACTGTATLTCDYSHTYVVEKCGGCAYSTDRVHGMFRDSGNAWAWVAASDIINCYACDGSALSPNTTTQATLGCPATGLRTLNADAQVRGNPTNDGCADHHYLATMPQGSHFLNKGPCPGQSDCFWCSGYAYGEVNQVASIECSKLT